jgi:DNA-binding LacI/PurR family transcriptional regulator
MVWMARERKSARITLSEVAERAGVSRALASLAIRGEPGVTPEKRSRILQAAADLNYTANPAARSLASGESKTIGVLVSNILNPFQAALTKAIDAAARTGGLDVLLSINGGSDSEAEHAIANLIAQRVAGLVLIDAPQSVGAVERINWQIPVIYVGRHLPSDKVDCISNDDFLGATILARRLIEIGHKHIVHIDGGTGAGAIRRRNGFVSAVQAAGLVPHVISGGYSIDAGAAGAREALEMTPRPTAIFAANDFAALGVLNTLLDRGLSVPEDIAVVGYDDMPQAGTETISLTTMRQPMDRIATQSIQALTNRMKSPKEPAVRILVSPILVERRSTLGKLPAKPGGVGSRVGSPEGLPAI